MSDSKKTPLLSTGGPKGLEPVRCLVHRQMRRYGLVVCLALVACLPTFAILTRKRPRRGTGEQKVTADCPSCPGTSALDFCTLSLRRTKLHTQQARPGSVLFMGDSITEGALVELNNGIQAVNLAIGATGVVFYDQHADEYLSGPKPAAVVIALGVNDAQRCGIANSSAEKYIKKWGDTYRDLVKKIQAKDVLPILVTILPVEKGKALGDGYFDPTMIVSLNRSIRAIASAEKLPLVDLYEAFVQADGFSVPGSTSDGVHPTPKSYKIWTGRLTRSVQSILAEKRATPPIATE